MRVRSDNVTRVWWLVFFFSSRRRHTRLQGDWSSDVCSSDLLSHLQWPSGAFSVKRSTPQQRSVQYSPFKAPLAPFLSLPSFHPCPKRSSMPHIQIGRASCRERV